MSVCLSVCLYRRISLTAEPIRFFFTGQLLKGPGKVYNYFMGQYHHPPQRNRQNKKKTVIAETILRVPKGLQGRSCYCLYIRAIRYVYENGPTQIMDYSYLVVGISLLRIILSRILPRLVSALINSCVFLLSADFK